MPEEIASLQVNLSSNAEKVFRDLTVLDATLLEISKTKYNATLTTNSAQINDSLKALNTQIKALTGTAGRSKDRKIDFSTNANSVKSQLDEIKAGLQSLQAESKKPIDISSRSGASSMDKLTTNTKRATGAQRELGQSVRETKGFFDNLKGAVTIFGTGYLAIMAIQKGIEFVKGSLYDLNNTLSQTEIGFETILGSVDKAKQLLSASRTFAIKTPFTIEGLMPDIQKLLSFGVINKNQGIGDIKKQVISTMTAIGDATFALGRGQEGIDRVILAFGQMHTATIAQAQDLRQLKEIGIDAWKYLAEATGKSTFAVKQMVHDGLIPADQAIKTILAGMERDFAGGMAKAAKRTLGGALEVTMDTLKTTLADSFKPVYEQFVDMVNSMNEAMDSATFTDKLDDLKVLLQGTLKQSLMDISTAFKFLYDTITKNPGAVKAALALLLGNFVLLTAASGGATKLFLLAGALHAVSSDTGELGRAARIATPIITGLAIAITALNAAQAAQNLMAPGEMVGGKLANVGKLRALIDGAKSIGGSALGAASRIGLGGGAALGGFGVDATSGAAGIGGVTLAAGAGATAALVALPALVAMIGTAGIAWEKYQEQLARVSAANAQLASTNESAKKSLQDIQKYAGADPKVLDAISNLSDQYDRLHGSLAGLSELKSKDIPALIREIRLSPKFDDIDRTVLNDAVTKYQSQIDAQAEALKFKATIDANPTSFANLKAAFSEILGFPHKISDNFHRYAVSPIKPMFTGLWDFIKNGFADNFQYIQNGPLAGLVRGITNAFKMIKDGYHNAFYNVPASPMSLPADPRYYDQHQRNLRDAGKASIFQGPTRFTGSIYQGPTGPTAKQIADMRAAQRKNASLRQTNPIDPLASGATSASNAISKANENAAKSYDALASAAEKSAQRQIDALKGISDSVSGVFESLQKKLLDAGVINNPLGSVINELSRMLNLGGQAAAISGRANATISGYQNKANALRGSTDGAAQFGANLADEMAASVHKSVGIKQACARFVSNWFGQMDIAVKHSDSAAQLIHNALAAGAKRIPVSQAGAGDLLFMKGSGPSGRHVGIGAGNGMFAAKNHDRFGSINGYGWTGALDTSALTHGAATVSSRGVDVMAKLDGIVSSVSGALSSIVALPKGWGGSVKNNGQNTARFAFQNFLATDKGQATLQDLMSQRHLTKDQAAWTLRKTANKADVAINRAMMPANIQTASTATAAYNQAIKDSIALNKSNSDYLKQMGYDAAGYARQAAIAAETQKITNNVNKQNISQAQKEIQIKSQLAAFTKQYDDNLRASALLDYSKQVRSLDDAFAALDDTTVQAQIHRKVYMSDDAQFMTDAQKSTLYQKELRNAIAATNKTLAESTFDKARQMMLGFINQGTDALQQLKNQFAADDAEQRRKIPGWQPTPDILAGRAQQENLTIQSTNYTKFSDVIKQAFDAINATGGTAGATQVQKFNDAISALWAGLNLLNQTTPLTAKQFGDFSDAIKDLENRAGKLKDTYTELLRQMQLTHAITMITNPFDRDMAQYKQGLVENNKDGNLSPADIDRLVAQERANKQAENVQSYLNDFNTRAGRITSMTDWGAQADQIKRQFLDQGFSQDEISQFLGKEKWLYAFSELQGIFNNAFGAIYTEGIGGFINSVESGITNRLNRIASQILASYATKLIMNLIGMGTGGDGLGSVIGGVIGIGSGGNGSLAGGGGGFLMTSGIMGSHATGLDSVPYDNYVANLHKGEAVLTASEAQMWRNMTTGVGSSGGGSSALHAGGSTTVVNNYYSIGTMTANNPQEFTKKIAGTKVSRSQTTREALGFVSKGRASN